MRHPLLLALALVAVTAPMAMAQTPPPAEPAPSDCTVEESTRRANEALRRALRKPLPAHAGETVPVRFSPCSAGRVVLRVHHGSMKGALVATGERTLRTARTATVFLRTTRKVERLRGKRLKLSTRATFTVPAA
jgi:hypothetical protein